MCKMSKAAVGVIPGLGPDITGSKSKNTPISMKFGTRPKFGGVSCNFWA